MQYFSCAHCHLQKNMGSVNVEGIMASGWSINHVLRCSDILGPGRPWEGLPPPIPPNIS